jgi:hypothetical protein
MIKRAALRAYSGAWLAFFVDSFFLAVLVGGAGV